MKRRSKEQWQALFKQQSESGLSIAEFCKKHSLGQAYFYKRKSELNTEPKLKNNAAFIKVDGSAFNHTQVPLIKIQHDQSQISLPMSVSPQWIADFVKALA